MGPGKFGVNLRILTEISGREVRFAFPMKKGRNPKLRKPTCTETNPSWIPSQIVEPVTNRQDGLFELVQSKDHIQAFGSKKDAGHVYIKNDPDPRT